MDAAKVVMELERIEYVEDPHLGKGSYCVVERHADGGACSVPDYAVIKLFRQMGNDFAVRFRLEYMTFFQKIFFQIHIVFNNAIVNDDKMIIFIPMGMGIHI